MAKFRSSFSALIFLTLLILGAEGSSLRTIFNGYAPSTGKVPIKKDSNGYYVDVDYVQNPTSSSDTGKWILSLVSSKTIIGGSGGCLKFNRNGCSRNNCKSLATTQTDLVDPYFTGKGKKVTAELYLDRTYWISKENAYLTDSCNSQLGDWVGYAREGIIGLSQDSLGDKNYPYYKSGDGTIIQISMNKDLSGGMLTFYQDHSYSGYNSIPIIADTSDGSMWRTQTMYCGVTFPNSANKFMAAKVMFDPFSDIITLPPELFTFIANTLSQYGAFCSSYKVRPQCTFNNYISKLPPLTVRLGDSYYNLPPSVYLKDYTTEYQPSITLNIKGSDSAYTGESYIHANFKNTIIWNDRWMSYYLIVFKQKSINLFYVPDPEKPKPTPTPTPEPKPEEPKTDRQTDNKTNPKETNKSSSAAINPLIPVAVVLVVVAGIAICIKMRQQKAAAVLTKSLTRSSFSEDPASPQKPLAHQQILPPQQTSPQQNFRPQAPIPQQNLIPQQNYSQQVSSAQHAYPQQQAYIPPKTSVPQQNFNPENYFANQTPAPQLNFAQHANPFHPLQ